MSPGLPHRHFRSLLVADKDSTAPAAFLHPDRMRHPPLVAAALLMLCACGSQTLSGDGAQEPEALDTAAQDPEERDVAAEENQAAGDPPRETPAVECRETDEAWELESWMLLIDNEERYSAASLVSTRDGSIVVCGDGFLAMLDTSGNTLWKRTADVYLASIVEDRDGNLVATGCLDSSDGTDPGLWVARLDHGGNILWQKRSSSYGECGHAVIETQDGSLVVAGAFGGNEAWVVKLDADGAATWQKRFGNYEAYSVVEAEDGSLFVLAVALGSIEWSSTRVIKLDPEGAVLWERRFYDDSCASLAMLPAPGGGVITAGCDYLNPDTDISLRMIDDSGSMVWHRMYGTNRDESALAAAIDPDGAITLVGDIGGWDPNRDIVILEVGPDGTLLRQLALDISARDYSRAVALLPDGGIAVAGNTEDSDATGTDIFVARLGPDGGIDGACRLLAPLAFSESSMDLFLESRESVVADTSASFIDAQALLVDDAAAACLLCPE